MKSSISWPGAPMALASAALFGASTPLAKLLLGGGWACPRPKRLCAGAISHG